MRESQAFLIQLTVLMTLKLLTPTWIKRWIGSA
ncbi:MAG: hypothetical protein ACI8T1_003912, partial [Verrucomicrobiales bacterium]